MSDIDRFSRRVVDLAERFADVTDAAQGRGHRSGGKARARWLILPAAGLGVYALGASGALMRQAKQVANEAKERVSELPDDLMGRLQEATSKSSGHRGSNGQARQPARASGSRPRTSSGGSRSRSSRSRSRTSSR